MSVLSERIKELRNKRGYTQDQLAEMLNMKRANFSSYETGRTIPPSDTLGELANLLNTTTEYLLGHTDNPFPVDESLMKAAAILYNQLNESISYFVLLCEGDFVFSKKLQNDVMNAINQAAEESNEKFNINFKGIADRNGLIDYTGLLSELDLDQRSNDFKLVLLEKIKEVAIKYHLWEDPREFPIKESPSSYVVEKELFDKSIELSDEEIKEKFEFKIDGRELTEEEYNRMIAAVRFERQFRDHK
ncbi:MULTISPECIES: helix-turn-helix domain-containing protein [Paenibacillus]|uniref:HTH cro/C1-type domain-containing protein n=1 Tax=Paenibacillus albilobatus TaxID=2716884 RepID=A0A919XNN3_9BACL|nr:MULTISPECIES: helix-turn-helix transcriptional regulator [Paenibacillus]GIO33710.1 hypothetical protein J2TS6_48510 [Paenibacillus albilobatus]